MKWFIGIGAGAGVSILFVALLSRTDAPRMEDAVPHAEGPVQIEIQRLIQSADSVRAEKKVESAILLMETAVELIEREGERFDSLLTYALMRLGHFYVRCGLYVDAIRYYSQCLDIRDKERWLGPSTVADVARRMGASYANLGQYYQADSLVREAIGLLKSTSEPDSFVLAQCLRALGRVGRLQLRYEESEECFKQALAICSSPSVEPRRRLILESSIRGRLGDLYFEQGRLSEAELQYRRALEVSEDPRLRDRQRLSEFLDNVGKVYEEKALYDEAEDYYRRALLNREEGLGLTHPWLVYHLLNLADVQISRGNYSEAASNCFLSLGIIKKAGYGSRHPQRARAKRILGDSYRGRGRHLTAEKFYAEAAEICKQVFQQYHPEVVKSLEGLALLYVSTGETTKTLKVNEDLLKLRYDLIKRVFSRASEAQKMRYVNMYSPIDYPLYSLAISQPSEELKTIVLEMTLKGKAIVLDALAKEHELARRLDDPNFRRVREQWDTINEKIYVYMTSEYLETLSEQLADSLRALRNVSDSLESELNKYAPSGLLLPEFDVADIADLVPEEGVLWEFARYRPFDLSRLRSDPKALGDPRYLAFTLEQTGKTTLTDLGDAETIDSLTSLVRDEISLDRTAVHADSSGRLEKQLREATQKLYELVFAPLQAQIGEKREILVSCDGQLNLLPFDILPCPDGKYVIERFKISYLSSGRDLLRSKAERKEMDSALVMANPDFDWCPGPAPMPKHLPRHPLVPFDRLHGTEEEARSISGTLRNKTDLYVDVYTGVHARVDVLEAIKFAPRILHIATHGFFREGLDDNGWFRTPLLRCGLAFTGANCRFWSEPYHDSSAAPGILTGLEASRLNLVGTELVTLSACETGVGEVMNGEGVYALSRSFQHAGARTILMSLWKVRAEETRELMVQFYEVWLAGKTKKEALREAALKVMNSCRAKYGNTHPYFWGGFVLMGDPN